jgi:hypothetical protein
MSSPREIIEALSRRGNATTIDYLAERGPSNATAISQVSQISGAGARARLVKLHVAGVVELEDRLVRWFRGGSDDRYYLDPDALRYAARWLDALADRAEHANRAAAIAPMPGGGRDEPRPPRPRAPSLPAAHAHRPRACAHAGAR